MLQDRSADIDTEIDFIVRHTSGVAGVQLNLCLTYKIVGDSRELHYDDLFLKPLKKTDSVLQFEWMKRFIPRCPL